MINKIINNSRLSTRFDNLDDKLKSRYLKNALRAADRIAYLNERQRSWSLIEIVRSNRYANKNQ
jgi:hypothetical protein